MTKMVEQAIEALKDLPEDRPIGRRRCGQMDQRILFTAKEGLISIG
jgi:hypothetical protein